MRFPRHVSSSRIDLVPDAQGATCGSCLTLNPPGAAACIRCNRPLPGSSAAAAAAVQPPGYGTRPEAPRPPPPEFTAEQQRRLRRRIVLVGSLVVALVLVGGGLALWATRPHYLDTAAVATRVSQELSARLGEPVTVECRGAPPRRRAGETFGCAATDAHGAQQTVLVTILDDTGRYRWTLG
jgi:hypothetical protein